MTHTEDPRLTATRDHALEIAVKILISDGVLAVTHGSVSKATGISRSTLYRHWPEVALLRNHALRSAAVPPNNPPLTDGPLRVDLAWTMNALMSALNETAWEQVAPQVIAAASTEAEIKLVINDLMQDRMVWVESIFEAARARGELRAGAPVHHLIETAIAVPYFRKFIAGLPVDQEWMDSHVDFMCAMAEEADKK
ncbi:MAG: TetR-like C-terminal domain-containing protein [Pseudomonadota bacterium]